MCEVKRTAESLDASDQLRQRVSALEAERDALKARLAALADAGTGYSQQTVDAITRERDALKVEVERQQAQIAHMQSDYKERALLHLDAELRAEKAETEVARLRAACAAKDAALRSARELLHSSEWPSLCNNIEAALSDTAGKGWIDATGAVESMALPVLEDGNAWIDDTPLPAAWVGKSVLILVKP